MRVISGFTMPPYTNIYTNILHRNTQWFIYSRANPNKSEIFLFYHTIHHTHILALLQPHDRISDENVKTNGNNGPEKHKSHNRGATFVRITSASPYSHIYWDWFTTLPQSQRCRCADLCSGGQISPSCSHMHASFPYAVLGWCQTLCRDGGLIRHEGPCHSTNQHRWDFAHSLSPAPLNKAPYARHRALSATGEPRSAIGSSPRESPGAGGRSHWTRLGKTQTGSGEGFGSAIKLAACDCDSFDSQEESK